MSTPEISVVMGVYNGAEHLEKTLRSVLSQEGCDFEFVVVNDGSTDDTGRILDKWAARNHRLRIFHQDNTGLTRALIRGCAEASGEFIARQDAGDISLPGRLLQQVIFLRNNPDSVMVSAGTRFIGPAGEELYEIKCIGEELEKGLSNLDVHTIQGPPHHGSTMFRKDAYLVAGGYRAVFSVAQDMDLWLRLVEYGKCWGLDNVLYEANVVASGISFRRKSAQMLAGKLAIECAKLRRAGKDDQSFLDKGSVAFQRCKSNLSRMEKFRFYYFVAACLRNRDPVAAKRYFRLALRENPLSLKAVARSLI